jgi:hypothetical protein
MIQVTTLGAIAAIINTEANRIKTSAASSQIRHLMKFTNDLSGAVHYAYGASETIYPRYTLINITYSNTPDIYAGTIKLLPAGYYKYEAYEVWWEGTVTISDGNAPATEDDVLDPPAATKGIVQGLVAIGMLNLTEKAGSEQVQYNQHEEASGTNYIWYGQ